MRVTGPGQKRRRRRREERGEEKRLVYGNMAGRWEFDGRMSHYRALWPPPLLPPALLSPSFDTVRVPASVPSAIQREANALNENGWCTFNIVNWSGVRSAGEGEREEQRVVNRNTAEKSVTRRGLFCFICFLASFFAPCRSCLKFIIISLSLSLFSFSFCFYSLRVNTIKISERYLKDRKTRLDRGFLFFNKIFIAVLSIFKVLLFVRKNCSEIFLQFLIVSNTYVYFIRDVWINLFIAFYYMS